MSDEPTVRRAAPGLDSLLRSTDTGGALAVLEYSVPRRTLVAPLHTHRFEDEYTYVLEGVLGLQVGAAVVEARPGDLVPKPKGIAHTLWNPADERARALELLVPGGFERFFTDVRDAGGMAPASGADRPGERLAPVFERYGLEMQHDSVERLEQAHGVTFR